MRLNELEKRVIMDLSKKYFGEKAKVYLFGSRVYDDKKGGDIDLYIETDKDIEKAAELEFLSKFHRLATLRKVDLLVKTPFSANVPIYKTAKNEGILLC
jgi:predicted nucleotidyltransferase